MENLGTFKLQTMCFAVDIFKAITLWSEAGYAVSPLPSDLEKSRHKEEAVPLLLRDRTAWRYGSGKNPQNPTWRFHSLNLSRFFSPHKQQKTEKQTNFKIFENPVIAQQTQELLHRVLHFDTAESGVARKALRSANPPSLVVLGPSYERLVPEQKMALPAAKTKANLKTKGKLKMKSNNNQYYYILWMLLRPCYYNQSCFWRFIWFLHFSFGCAWIIGIHVRLYLWACTWINIDCCLMMTSSKGNQCPTSFPDFHGKML